MTTDCNHDIQLWEAVSLSNNGHMFSGSTSQYKPLATRAHPEIPYLNAARLNKTIEEMKDRWCHVTCQRWKESNGTIFPHVCASARRFTAHSKDIPGQAPRLPMSKASCSTTITIGKPKGKYRVTLRTKKSWSRRSHLSSSFIRRWYPGAQGSSTRCPFALPSLSSCTGKMKPLGDNF